LVEKLHVSLVHCGAREAIIGKAFVESPNYDVKLDVLGKFVNPLLNELVNASEGKYYIRDTAEKGNIPDIVYTCRYSDLVFIGNETPIINALPDALRKEKIPVIAPNGDFSLEGDKNKTRLILEEVHPQANPRFYYIDPEKSGWKEEVRKAIDELYGKVALKPIESKYGKGVIVEGSHFTCGDAYEKALDTAKAGPFLIEEKVIGQEWSGQYLCDSKGHIEAFPASRDFKRAFENDKGPNTGGMATISDNNELLPFMLREEFDEGKTIVEEIVAYQKQRDDYKDGVLTGTKYPGFSLTGSGNKMFEHNDRFGDPEGMNALSVLKNDFVDVCLHMIDGNIPRLEFEPKAVATIYAVPLTYGGFIKEYTGDKTIRMNKGEMSAQTQIYPGSVELVNGDVRVMSSRSVAVVSKADTLEEALTIVNEDITKIDGPLRHRTDVDMDYVRKCASFMRRERAERAWLNQDIPAMGSSQLWQ
jgi:phosphoribosylamine--glycine ligase